ncbi:LuxR C-terminal-related transcriptional regulator [Actinomycetospora soli]|uniref:LuxR C-terminal-related transcriptional regulator n=1 Tax=Actinomycetospora soli TaxID=2893887 RepID=UPI001E50B5F4|nr:response regulator transcription factor [Actinomycetospora soli]MCD2191763.1 response regulator transcription factor [Actinomycetospora soli]
MQIALLDDSPLFRAALRLLLETLGQTVVGDVATGDELLPLLERNHPDVAIVDICLSSSHRDDHGLSVAADAAAAFPEVGLLVLSTYDDTSYATRLLQIRSSGIGYLLKDRVEAPSALVEALHRVAAGQTAIDVDIVGRLVRHQKTSGALDALSPRERDVLQLIAEGRSNSGIGEALCLSARTVEAHIANLFTRLDLTNTDRDNRRVLAALRWLQATRHPSGP